jgi:N-acetylmuramoyl-L-alanine amidase
MSKFIWILDPGHGGLDPNTGEYVTPGKRSPIWDDNTQYFEGEGNRCIVNSILKQCRENNIIAIDVVNDWQDVSLATRVNRANSVNSYHGNCIYVSVHSNGFSQESAHGYSVYTSRGNTKSDQYAEILLKYMQLEFPDRKMRKDTSDSDRDKEADFYVLSKTSMPAILSENFFMTNKEECKLLLQKSFRDRVANCHFELIKQIENG